MVEYHPQSTLLPQAGPVWSVFLCPWLWSATKTSLWVDTSYSNPRRTSRPGYLPTLPDLPYCCQKCQTPLQIRQAQAKAVTPLAPHCKGPPPPPHCRALHYTHIIISQPPQQFLFTRVIRPRGCLCAWYSTNMLFMFALELTRPRLK